MSSTPVGGGSDLESLRAGFEEGPVRIEDITIHATNGLKVRSVDGVTIAWEEGQPLYRVHGSSGMDPSELTAVVESMQ